MKRAMDWLVYLVVRVAYCTVQVLSLETCESLAEMLAWVANDVVRLRGRITDENLRQVFPHWSEDQRRALARRMWKHLFLMGCEIAHAHRKIHATNYRRYISFRGKDQIVRYLLDPRPMVLVTGHFGNWELLAAWVAKCGYTHAC